MEKQSTYVNIFGKAWRSCIYTVDVSQSAATREQTHLLPHQPTTRPHTTTSFSPVHNPSTITTMNVLSSPVHMMERLFDSVDSSPYRTARSEAPPQGLQAFSGRLYDVAPDMGFFPAQPCRKLTGEFSR